MFQKSKKVLAKLLASDPGQRMSTQDIQNWISAARSFENEFDEHDMSVSTVPSRNVWEDFMELALVSLTSSSSKKRVSFLNQKILPLSQHRGMVFPFKATTLNMTPSIELDIQRASDVFDLLIITYPRYIDAVSRDAVLAVLSSLVKRDAVLASDSSGSVTGVLDYIIRWLDSETMRLCSLK